MLTEATGHFSANKFHPPYFDESQALFRTELIEGVFTKRGLGKKIIIIEGQAGQGKTSAAEQFLKHNHLLYSWFQIGEEDNNPVLFLSALYFALTRSVDGFHSALLEQRFGDGQLAALDLGNCCNSMLLELDKCLKRPLYLVLDDVHLLKNQGAFGMIGHLIEKSSLNLRFILLSRQKIPLNPKSTQYGTNCLVIENDALALSLSETGQLIGKILGSELLPAVVRAIHQRTEGWVMGLVLFCLVLESRRLTKAPLPVIEKALLASENTSTYFMQEVFSSFADELKATYCKLALLDEIPLDLAMSLTGKTAGQSLHMLQRQSCFMRSLNSEHTTFGFHHLFQHFLRQKARFIIPPDEIHHTLQMAAEYYRRNNLVLTALKYFLAAGDDNRAEELLQDKGMELVGLNRLVSLRDMLHGIDETRIRNSGWFCLYYGLSLYDAQPVESEAYFNHALTHFSSQGEFVGELLSLSHLLYYHCSVSGRFNDARDILARADSIYPQTCDLLQPTVDSLICVNLSASHTFITFDREKIGVYNNRALRLSQSFKLSNIDARFAVAQGYALLFQGKPLISAVTFLERAHELVLSEHVGIHNKVVLVGMQANFLVRLGHFTNFHRHRVQIIDLVGKEAVGKTIIGTWLAIWNMTTYIAEGSYERALQRLEEELLVSLDDLSPHMTSNILQWKAYALSLLNRHEEAILLADESKKLRDRSGGPQHIIINLLLVGSMYGRLGNTYRALELLDEAVDLELKHGQNHLLAAGYCQRGWIYHQAGNSPAAHDDFRKGLQLMRENGFLHFETWNPDMMQPLLDEAVRANIEPNFAQHLAKERLQLSINKGGNSLPFLRIRVLGRMTLSLGNEPERKLTLEQLTPALRSLIALLTTSPEQRISQEKVQITYWPDIPPDKAKARFDTLMTRVRKLLNPFLHPYSLKHYFGMRQGILYLDNCWIDAREFTDFYKQGLKFARAGNWWQAENSFQCALELWEGCLGSELFAEDQIQDYCRDLLQQLVEMSILWSGHLTATGRPGEAERILTHAWNFDTLNHSLVKEIYSLKNSQGQPALAMQAIKLYEQLLIREGYARAEIESFIADALNFSCS